MPGSRRILIISEDPRTLKKPTNQDDIPFCASSLFCLGKCCDMINAMKKEDYVVSYAFVFPGKQNLGEWKSVSDSSDVQEIQSYCASASIEETCPINYRQIYDALMKLKDSISVNDVLSILWLVPSFSLFSSPVLSVRSDSQKAPFLYLGLEALQHASKSSELSIITHDNSNDLSVWTRLFDCCSYWIQPSLLPIHIPSNQEPSEDEYHVKTTTSSLIIEHPSDSLFSSKPIPANSSHLPVLECETIYSLTVEELDLVFNSLLRTDISQKCVFEWSELDHSLISRLSNQSLHALTRSVSVSLLTTQTQSEVVLSPDQPIHILNQFNSYELLRSMYVFLEKTESFHFSVPHPTKNPLASLFHHTSMDSTVQYYGCSVVGQTREHEEIQTFPLLSNRSSATIYSKPRHLIGLLAVSSHDIELLVSYADWEKPEGILRSVIESSLQHDDYLMIVDDDIQPSLLHTVLQDQFGETYPLFISPSAMPPICRDVTGLSQSITPEQLDDKRKPRQLAQASQWSEERILQRVSELMHQDTDQWRLRLFGDTSHSAKTVKHKEPRRSQLLASIHGVATKPLRVPQDCYDITRGFLANGEPATDMSLFEFQSLSIPSQEAESFPSLPCDYESFVQTLSSVAPDQIRGSVYFQCRSEDYWDQTCITEETKITSLLKKTEAYGSLMKISGFAKASRTSRQNPSIIDVNNAKLDKLVNSIAMKYVPSGYRESILYGKIIDLSTQLCKAVLETFYDIQKVVLPSTTISKEVKKQVRHVVNSLIPPESTDRPSLSRSSRLSEFSLVDGSPFSVRDQGTTPDTSLLGTPSSLSTFLGHDSKRFRTIPPLPMPPSDMVYPCFFHHLKHQQTCQVISSFDIYTPSK